MHSVRDISELTPACLAAAEADPERPTAAAVEAILAAASAWGASDVHLSPSAEEWVIRFRLDGVTVEVARLPREALPLLVQRIKVLAGLLTYRTDVPQDGRVPRAENGERCELRVSVVPVLHGEKAVVRLLDAADGPRSLDALGWEPAALDRLRAGLAARQGLIVFSGPAGSGKTTAIYAALRHVVARGERSCASIEEPVEAAIAGVDQTPVDRHAGLDFAHALRAILRQDPEVIFVGEVRDPETARTAVEAGLTGHLVLTTVHAGGACEAIARLLDLGVEPFTLASSLRQVLSQRLLRRACADCDTRGGACCRGTGYRGRVPLVEQLELDDPLRQAIMARASAAGLAEAAAEQALRTLREQGQAACAAGRTTAAEVERVLGPA